MPDCTLRTPPSSNTPLPRHPGGVAALAISRDSLTVYSGGPDKIVRVWEVASQGLRTSLTGHTAQVTCIASTPDSDTLVSGDRGGTIKFWDVPSRQPILSLGAH